MEQEDGLWLDVMSRAQTVAPQQCGAPATDIEQRLREAMDGVTPGPWVAEIGGKGGWVKGSTGEWCAMSCGDTNDSANANAAYIALCSPDNIGALLDENAAQAARIAELEGALTQIASRSGHTTNPDLDPEVNWGNYDDVFSDGEAQANFECADIARRTLASIRGGCVMLDPKAIELACAAHAPQWGGMDAEIKRYAREQMEAAITAYLSSVQAEPVAYVSERDLEFLRGGAYREAKLFNYDDEHRVPLTAALAEREPVAGLSLSELQRTHIERQEEWCPDQKPDLSFRGNEMAGEVGEACNVIKKLERERHGWRGSRATKEQLAEELADVIHTAVLCSITAGIDIEAATIAKFNATSEKNGLASRIRSALVATPPAETLPSPSSLSMSKGVITAAYDRDEDARRAYDILEGSATPPAGGDDWTVDDTLTAREILNYLGIGSDASLEPYADRHRDAVAKIIQKRVAATPPAERVVEAHPVYDELVRSRSKELHQKLGRDAMLRQNDPVQTIYDFAWSIWHDGFGEGMNEAEITTKPAVKDDEPVVEALRSEAGTAYCRFIDKMSAPLCLGVEHKLETGKFGAAELNAHVDARELYGFHRGINHALAALTAKDGRS